MSKCITVLESSNNFNLDLSLASNFIIQPLSTTIKTVTISNIPVTLDNLLEITVILKYSMGASFIYPQSVSWKDGVVPSYVTGNYYKLTFNSFNAGVNWFASYEGIWFIGSVPITPPAPNVTRDDILNTVSGMTTSMEYKLDSAGYVLYNSTVFNNINFAGNHTLLVRVAASGINPAGLVTTLIFTTNPTNTTFTSLLIPFYVYPTSGASTPDYVRLISLAKKYPNVQLQVIVNPSNGPGTSVDPSYTSAINALHAVANIKLIAYIHADYYMTSGHGTRTEASLEADMVKWNQLYPQVHDGVFVDEMSWIGNYNSTFTNFYITLKNYCHGVGYPLFVSNPGTGIPKWYFDYNLADVICIYESNPFPTESNLINAGYGTTISISKASILVYGTGIWNSTKFAMCTKYAKYVFVSDIPNASSDPWSSLTTTLEQQIALISS